MHIVYTFTVIQEGQTIRRHTVPTVKRTFRIGRGQM